MMKRVPVVPEPDGTLQVICGEDILIVEVVRQPSLLGAPRDFQPGNFPIYNDVDLPIWRNPNDKTVMLARPDKFDTASTYQIMSVLKQAYHDPHAANPRALVVGPVYGIDLHGVVKFAGQIQQHFPDTHFSIDLGLFQGLK